jgi:hypothetical protein
MYIREKKFKLNFNNFIWTNRNKIWILNVYVFIMFKMKYLINKCNVIQYHNKCGGLIAKVFASILKVKGSNFTNGVFVVNSNKLIEYFLM